MSDLDHARMMLQAALRDLRALQNMADPVLFADETFGFHAQQAAEKALKCWLSLSAKEYPRTHDIQYLLRLLDEQGQTVPDDFRALADLNDFAVQFRYEVFLDEPVDRPTLLGSVKRLVLHVDRLVAEATEPCGTTTSS